MRLPLTSAQDHIELHMLYDTFDVFTESRELLCCPSSEAQDRPRTVQSDKPVEMLLLLL